jgi:hypothetical protein
MPLAQRGNVLAFSDCVRIFETNHHSFSHIPVYVPTGRVAERWKMASAANPKNTVQVGVGGGFSAAYLASARNGGEWLAAKIACLSKNPK